MILVDPEPQEDEYSILVTDNAVAISSVFRLIKFGQSKESVGSSRLWLRGEVAEKFLSTVDQAVVIPVKG